MKLPAALRSSRPALWLYRALWRLEVRAMVRGNASRAYLRALDAAIHAVEPVEIEAVRARQEREDVTNWEEVLGA